MTTTTAAHPAPLPARPASPFMPTELAADYIGVCARTLERMRVEGSGPRFVKLGRLITYRGRDLIAFVEGGLQALPPSNAPVGGR